MEFSNQKIYTRYRFAFTYHGIDGQEQTYENEASFLGINHELSFCFIRDYIQTGKWPDEGQPYQRVFTDVDGFHLEPLFDAIRFYRDSIEQAIIHDIGIKCTEDALFAESIVNEAARVVKNKDKSAKMEWTNTRRRLRECQKRGKPVYRTEYMTIVEKYHLYTITDFSYEALD